MSESSDPFACFDSDDDEAPAVTASSQQQKNKDPHVIRDPSCGVLAFHRGTEQALWNYVSSEMEKSATSIPTTDLPGAVRFPEFEGFDSFGTDASFALKSFFGAQSLMRQLSHRLFSLHYYTLVESYLPS